MKPDQKRQNMIGTIHNIHSMDHLKELNQRDLDFNKRENISMYKGIYKQGLTKQFILAISPRFANWALAQVNSFLPQSS